MNAKRLGSARRSWITSAPTCAATAAATATAPTFLDSNIASQVSKSGYDRSFELGPQPGNIATAINSASSLSSYAYVASPVTSGQTGVRGFGGDSSGVLCFTSDGSAAPTSSGALDMTGCNVLQ